MQICFAQRLWKYHLYARIRLYFNSGIIEGRVLKFWGLLHISDDSCTIIQSCALDLKKSVNFSVVGKFPLFLHRSFVNHVQISVSDGIIDI